DVAKLEQYYRSFGFHDVHVTRELKWDETYHYVHVVFHIDEGARYKVGNVQVEGVGPLEQEQLLRLVRLHAGDWYSGDVVKADVTQMKDKIGYTGREANIQEKIAYFPGEVNVHYEVQERPPATVGQVIIYGNDVTRENVIRRQVPLYPGQTLTYPD